MQAPTEKREYILDTLERFKLVDIRREYDDLIAQANREHLGYEDFLVQLLHTEAAGKDARRRDRLVEQANFDIMTTLDAIAYSFNPSLDKSQIESLGKLNFLDAHENIILVRPASEKP